MKSNQITKYKKDLTLLYEEKIDKNNKQHMKMLYDIWARFNKYDLKINILYYFNLLFYILIWKEIIKKIIVFMGTHKIVRILEPEDISYLKYLELSN